MKTYLRKLKHILPAFLIITLSSVIGLSLCRWLLFIAWPVLHFKEEIWLLWIPMVFPWIPILIWLRPKLKAFRFTKDDDKRRTIFYIICWLTLTSVLVLSQQYLTTATGKLEKLRNITEIDKKDKVRYYQIFDFNMDQSGAGVYANINASGKHSETLNFDLYFVTPFLSDTPGVLKKPRYWYGTIFKQHISNRSTEAEKEERYNRFYEECVSKMNHYNFHALGYFERKPESEDRSYLMKAIEGSTKQPADENAIILLPVQGSYADRNGDTLPWLFGSLGIGLTVLLLAMIWPGFIDPEKHTPLKKPKQDDLADLLKFLIPSKKRLIMPLLIDLNILVWVIMVFSGVHPLSPDGIDLLHWGANRRAEVMDGAWWRLLTNIFLHGGIMHLVSNIYGLAIAAFFIEQVFGKWKFLSLYLLSGIGASLVSICWHPNTLSVGASGAIFGMYGAILVLLLTNAFPTKTKKPILLLMGFYVIVNLIFGLMGNIDNAAHIGGLLSGMLLGLLLYKKREKPMPAV